MPLTLHLETSSTKHQVLHSQVPPSTELQSTIQPCSLLLYNKDCLSSSVQEHERLSHLRSLWNLI